MSLEQKRISEESFAALGSCLIEGDPDQRKRERRIKRRALALSIVMQAAALVLVVLIPLFGKTERIVMASYVPIPPYRPASAPIIRNSSNANTPTQHQSIFEHFLSQPTRVPRVEPDSNPPQEPTGFSNGRRTGDGPMCPECISLDDNRSQPIKPHEEVEKHAPKRVTITNLEPAMLVHRVEPRYPPLGLQIRRGGRVELRAIIAVDGAIQSLQVVGGDALFYQSALDAVQRWRYRPTILNGQPVEVNTFITVIYNVNQ